MVVDAFSSETNYTVWNDVSNNLGKLALLLQNTECSDSFKTFLRQLFKPIADKIGWDAKEGEGDEFVIGIFTQHWWFQGLCVEHLVSTN